MTTIKNSFVSASFNEFGGIASLKCLPTNRELLNPDAPSASPFTVWTDPVAENDVNFRKSYIAVDTLPVEPKHVCKTLLTPGSFTLTECEATEDSIRMLYTTPSLKVELKARLNGCEMILSFTLRNPSDKPVSVLPVFPSLSDVDFDEKKGAEMLAMTQGGFPTPCWLHRGGFYGNTRAQSAQFDCLYDKETCLGFYVRDTEFSCKDFSYQKPSVEIRWAPGRTLSPGETWIFPEVVLMVYGGTWLRTAKAYGDWFRTALNPHPTPEWIKNITSYSGAWSIKKGTEHEEPQYPSVDTMDTLDELPKHFLNNPMEVREYAFYCEYSTRMVPYEPSPTGMRHEHTDGWNVIRSDMGGKEAMARGIKKVHDMKRFVTLYIEGLITPPRSDLYVHIPEAINWLFTDWDGLNTGAFTGEGWYSMCPGSSWPDHVAQMAARLVRETDCDGIRLDCLGCHFKPCWNETHHHESPYDYNRWMLTLFRKVAAAVRAVKPDVILSTEYPVDYFSVYFNHALFQAQDDLGWLTLRAPTPLNVALPHYRIDSWGGGPVAHAMQLVPMSTSGSNGVWGDTLHAVSSLFLDSEIMDDPTLSREDAQCRHTRTEEGDLLILARPDFPDRELSLQLTAWGQPWMSLKQTPENTTISLPLDYEPAEAFEFDLQTGAIRSIPFAYDGETLTLNTMCIFSAIVTRKEKGAAFLECKAEVQGRSMELTVTSPSLTTPVYAKLCIDGIDEMSEIPVTLPGKINLTIPENVTAGSYRMHLTGEGIVSTVKFVNIK